MAGDHSQTTEGIEQKEEKDEGSEDSTGEYIESVNDAEERRAVSVVESMHDISAESGVKHLTESELQLGKVSEFASK